jgi:hypothetical protein
MDVESASIILEREGIDRPQLARALRMRLKRRIKQMTNRGKEVPQSLVDIMNKL